MPSGPDVRLNYDAAMSKPLKIDFVSDIACPWCAVGLASLERAIERLGGSVPTELHFQPFELNPQMDPDGQDAAEHLRQKYGSTPAQQAAIRETIRARGAEVGFTFGAGGRSRIYNTFDAHRLLHWAGSQAKQRALNVALLEAYFTHDRNPSSHEVLAAVAGSVGLDSARACEILSGDEFSTEVRERERYYTARGIQSVPAIIIDGRHLISGAQPVEVFEQALRRIAAAGDAAGGQHR